MGKPLKRARVPQNILAGMIRKQEKREGKAAKLAKEAGIVTDKKKEGKERGFSERNRKEREVQGPSPNPGFMKGGVLYVKKS